LSGADEGASGDRRRILREEITSELRLSVQMGFEFLIKRQSVSGTFDSTFPVAANALAGIAFLAGGYSEKNGPTEYTQALKRDIEWLLANQNADGYFDDGSSRMYGHGFATLFLAELYGTSGCQNQAVRQALERAIRVIEGSQCPNGGWDYDPAPGYRGRSAQYATGDTSITVCQTMALRAARNLGLLIEAKVVDGALKYIKNAQNSDGGFCYRHSFESVFREPSTFPRSAAGVCILYSLGSYNSESIQRGFRYLDQNYRFPWSNAFPYYAHYYSAQAMFQAGGKHWAEYFPWIRKSLLKEQQPDGSWRANLQENSMQATAMALIVLQLPYRFLPIHER
jgi:squalene cyclase